MPRRRERTRPLHWLAWVPLLALVDGKNISTISIPRSGSASLTHTILPLDVITSCGCSKTASYFPTAALSQAAYGSSLASGPACGMCFNLTLKETFGAIPTWVLSEDQRVSVVVKIVDKCPAVKGQAPNKGWCGATDKKSNKANQFFHFDLSVPSPALNMSFFPSNASYYGYEDFGSWIIDFEQTTCENWSGWKNETTLGLDPSLTADSGCCSANPLVNGNVCPAFSLRSDATQSRRIGFAKLSLLAIALTSLHSLSPLL
ncbi:uncharacterized protein JCM6883_005755 [Sporobolomyces salmoneus]|uniref:uncharacterized protein n=1 Tax=Sporobolomyces salmoneus TaxID=183962 RepID=UPI00316B1772